MKKMSKLFIPSLLMALLLLFSCSNSGEHGLEPTTHDDITIFDDFKTMTLKDSVTPTSATFTYDNRTNMTFTLGEAYTIETNRDGKWYQVPVILEEDYGFHDIGYDIPPDEMMEMEINWEWLYGSLDPGEYRIIQEVLDVHEPGVYDTYTIATEFEVEKE